MFFFLFALGLVAHSLAVTVTTTATEQQEIVDRHNELRKAVKPEASNMLKMSWSREAAENAQTWANGCSLIHSPSSEREISTTGCGENLHMSSSQDSWSEAIESWYKEVQNWEYGVGSFNGGVVRHYTQMVWYRSNVVGCAMAYCPNAKYKYFYVCQYCPIGNVQFSMPYTKGDSCANCPGACDNKLCTNPCPYTDKFSNCPALKQQLGCVEEVPEWCPASCKCTTQII